MNVVERADFINSIEEQFPVDEWEAFGIKVWPVIRMLFYSRLRDEILGTATDDCQKERLFINRSKKTTNLIKSLFNEFRIYFCDYKNNDTLKRQADILFVINSPRILIDGEYYDIRQPYIESLKELNLSTMLIQTNPKSLFSIPRKTKSVLFKSSIEFIRLIGLLKWVMLKKNIFKKYHYHLESYSGFISYCKERGVCLKSIELDNVMKRVYLIKELSIMFEKKLKIIKPKVCFKVCYYNPVGFALNYACKNLKIISVDIQHGVQGDYHSAYGRWNKVPIDGFNILPRYFWCWSNKEVQVIDNWSNNVQEFHKAFNGGNFWRNMWIKKQGDIVNRIEKETKKLFINTNDSIKILYTMQPLAPPEEWLYEAINFSPDNWSWFIRLHPGMLKDIDQIINNFYLKCNNKVRIEFNLTSTLPLQALLNDIDIHITSYSTCVLEAKEFQVPSIVLSRTGKHYYSDLIDEGWVIYVSCSKDLHYYLEKLSKKKQALSTNEVKRPRDNIAILEEFCRLVSS